MVHFPATRIFFCNCTSFQRLRFFASNCGYCTSTNNITLLTEPRRPNPRKPIINRLRTRRQQQDLRRCVSLYGKRMRHFSISIFADLLFFWGSHGQIQPDPSKFPPAPTISSLCNSQQVPVSVSIVFLHIGSQSGLTSLSIFWTIRKADIGTVGGQVGVCSQCWFRWSNWKT